MTLSKENYDKLNTNYLYKKEPVVDHSLYIGQTPITYHCKNWTFKVSKYEDGSAYMRDTYFSDSSHSYEITDENIDDFKFVFDFREVRKIGDSHSNEYDEEDLYYVATNSGGYSCGGCYWINKDTKESKTLLIDKKKREIESLKNQMEWAERDLARLLE